MAFPLDSFFVDVGLVNVWGDSQATPEINIWTGGHSKSSKIFTEEQHIPDCRENKIKSFIVFCKAN